jgi:hypothetical protein
MGLVCFFYWGNINYWIICFMELNISSILYDFCTPSAIFPFYNFTLINIT